MMATSSPFNCPLCYQSTFTSITSLCLNLISVSTRLLECPMCREVLFGLDKFTIHLLGHVINHQQIVINNTSSTKQTQNESTNPLSILSLMNLHNLNLAPNQQTVDPVTQVQEATVRKNELTAQDKPTENTNNFVTVNTNLNTIHYDLKNGNNNDVSLSTTSTSLKTKTDSTIKPKTFVSTQTDRNSVDDLRKNLEPFLKCRTKTRNGRKQTKQNDNTNNRIDTKSSKLVSDCTTQTENILNNTELQTIKDKSNIYNNNDTILCNNHVNKQTGNNNSILLNNLSRCINRNETQQNHSMNCLGYNETIVKTKISQGAQTIEKSFTSTLHENEVNFLKLKNPLGMDKSGSTCNELNIPSNTVEPLLSDTSVKTFPTEEVGNTSMKCCDICLFTFPDEHILQMHYQLVHADSDPPDSTNSKRKSFGCHFCTKSFKMRGSLMVHRRVAHPSMTGIKTIDVSTTSNTSAKVNTSEILSDSLSPNNEPVYTCNICGKTFKKEPHLIQHEKTHEAKQWECDVCSKAFSTKYFLKKHRRLHTGEMPYTCTACGKNFTFQQSYHKHLLYHSDEKPHVCCECGRAFKELSTLHNHQRIHTGEKPFSCETCGKCFRQRVSYLVHRRIHTGVMPYKCSTCCRSFRYKVSERTHKCVSASIQIPNSHATTNEPMIDNCHSGEKTTDSSTLVNNHSEKSASTSQNIFPMVLPNDCAAGNGTGVVDKISTGVVNILLSNRNDTSTMIMTNDRTSSAINDNNDNVAKTNSTDIFETTDFLSLILSPAMTSPSEHLRNLTLSPNPSQQTASWEVQSFPENITSKYSNNGNDSRDTGDTNVNERSFSELMYQINDEYSIHK